jgi:pilus assembly protein CpaC
MNCARTLLFLLIAPVFWLAMGTLGMSQEQPPPKAPAPAASQGTILVPIGGSQPLQMKSGKKISSVAISAPNIVQVAPDATSPQTRIIISGLNAGSVTITLTDDADNRELYEVIVQLDVQYLRNLIKQAVPTSNVEIVPSLNRTVVLRGWVALAGDADIILKIATSVLGQGSQVINAMRIGGVQQVQLDVTVASVSRSEARRRGFSFAVNGHTVSAGSILGGLASSTSGTQTQTPVPGAVGIVPAAAQLIPNGPPTGANIVFGVVPWNFQALIQALRDENLAKLLAEPKLITMSGRPAHMLAGGQQAVLSAQGSIGGPGVDFKEIGTELDFLPIVQGNGRILLEVSPRVRAVNQALGITTSFGFVPGFSEQSVRTLVEMEPGQTFAIGGLLQTVVQASAERIPFLGDLPFVGVFFNSVFYSQEEDELVILVTPHLVDPMDCNQAPKHLPGRETRGPDDYELFLEYILEAPRGQRQVFENGRYKAAYKNDPTYGRFPCAEDLPWERRMAPHAGMGNGNGNCSVCQPAMNGAPVAPAANPAAPVDGPPPPKTLGMPAMPLPPGFDPRRSSSGTDSGMEILPPGRSTGRSNPTTSRQPTFDDDPR